jgi:hypothetical protein
MSNCVHSAQNWPRTGGSRREIDLGSTEMQREPKVLRADQESTLTETVLGVRLAFLLISTATGPGY